MMREVVNCGIKYLIMEVSSHALSLGRIEGIEFDIAVFTNLTQDHLDFHKDMNDYFEAKSKLFSSLSSPSQKHNSKYAIINADDKYAKKLIKSSGKAQIKLYSSQSSTKADFKAENIITQLDGSSFDLIINSDIVKAKIKSIGLHNIYNTLAVSAICSICGVSKDVLVEALNSMSQAPGRLERVIVSDKQDFEVVVDYAHTDDALKNVLSSLKKVKHNKIITVFGCGGDRDRTKRPLMGRVAVEMSDFVFVTSDNPRTEDPNIIVLDIELGIKRIDLTNYKVIVDRDAAIKEAIFSALSGDIVLIAGKGHENYQIIGRDKIHFDDREIAAKYIHLKETEKDKKNSKENASNQEEFKF
jgi:UDP-N-acetylmuramoyl-L-alanyl-D-glutamate--2,6-diaminopimelate ligase